jgi:dipeptide transport system permease protein
MPYLRLLGQRLLMTILTLWGLATVVFLMIKLIPGDEAHIAAGPDATPAQVKIVAHNLGLDLPLPQQYLAFMSRLRHGDLGTSIISSRPVLADLSAVLPSTLELLVFSTLLGLLMAFPAALVSAARRDGVMDFTGRLVVIIAGALPAFWLALMLQYFLGAVWQITPISGQNSFGVLTPVVTGAPTLDALLAGNFPALGDALRYLILPAFVFAVPFACQVYRILRATLLGVLASDLILPVRAKGASPTRIVLRHALPNALAPTVSLIGTLVGGMIAGAVLVETVFARRGVGTYLANAVALKDTYAVLGTVMFIGLTVCVVNLAADLVTLLIDPRLKRARFAGAAG